LPRTELRRSALNSLYEGAFTMASTWRIASTRCSSIFFAAKRFVEKTLAHRVNPSPPPTTHFGVIIRVDLALQRLKMSNELWLIDQIRLQRDALGSVDAVTFGGALKPLCCGCQLQNESVAHTKCRLRAGRLLGYTTARCAQQRVQRSKRHQRREPLC
jgi:hypothetical protein